MGDGTWTVRLVDRSFVKDFIEKWHYSGSINGVMASYCFGLFQHEELKGAMLYGKLGMANTWKKYGQKESDVIELRRLCLVDDTPKNAESFFIGKTLRWLKQNTDIKTIVSYADQNHGHQGIIYQATNFTRVGLTAKGKVIDWNGKIYHDKAIRTKYKGELKPFAKRLVEALEKREAFYKDQIPKVIYVKEISRKGNKSL